LPDWQEPREYIGGTEEGKRYHSLVIYSFSSSAQLKYSVLRHFPANPRSQRVSLMVPAGFTLMIVLQLISLLRSAVPPKGS
jgi:hypothetical protein